MQYNAITPIKYLDLLADDWRKEKLLELRMLLQIYAPSLQEGMNYRMLSYSDEKGSVFHLNAQKNYVSLYVGDAKKIDIDGSLLKGLNVGKGCIRLTKSVKLADTRLAEFIEKTVQLWENGTDIDC